jgi:probable F420-dependent oxidoreductase
MRIGAKLPSSGPLPVQLGVPHMAVTLESAGFASVWVSDHVVMPSTVSSRYPYASDGVASWAMDDPWFDAMVVLSIAAGVTSTVELGTAVLVLPQRQPLILAKEVASLDRLAGGRVVLGVGSGWLAEEFDALATPFDSRGARTDEWIALLRACWTGRPERFDGEHYSLPAGIICEPTPARPVPILIGGKTKPALRRARELGDGWLGIEQLDAIDPTAVAAAVESLPPGSRRVLRIVGSGGHADRVAALLPGVAAAGVTDVVVDVDWTTDVASQAAVLLAAAGN